MAEKINIIIVEDQKSYREGLSSSLKEFNINTIAEAGNGSELLEILKFEKPDVVLLDLEMPELDGSKTLDRICKEFPNTKAIIVTQYNDESLIKNFLTRGACAFLTKDTEINIIAYAIRVVKATGFYTDNITKLYESKSKKRYYKQLFTRREKEIIKLMCEGKTGKVIAEELNIVEKTVEAHRKDIYNKTNTKSNSEFLIHAIKEGLNYLGTSDYP